MDFKDFKDFKERRDICFLCGEKGHWARNCPKKQQQYKAD